MISGLTLRFIEYRLARANETLEEASLMLEANRGNAAVNRLYYASFYAISTLLLAEGHAASRHTQIRSLFGRHYVKTGRLSQELGAFFNELFDRRHEGDYQDMVRFEVEMVKPWFATASQLIACVEALISESIASQEKEGSEPG